MAVFHVKLPVRSAVATSILPLTSVPEAVGHQPAKTVLQCGGTEATGAAVEQEKQSSAVKWEKQSSGR